MTCKTHMINRYQYSFDSRIGRPGRLYLWGDAGMIAEIGFVDDNSPVPTPVTATDLNSTTASFKLSAFSGLIRLLRNQSPVCVSITDQSKVNIFKAYGLPDSLVVSSACSADLIEAKTSGIREAMRRLVNYCGADGLPEICPITFHLSGDGYCGAYKSGMTGGFSRDPSGYGHVCLYDVEKENRSLPFTVENAQKIQDQLLPVHEAMHGWFVGRQENYLIQEPFCKIVSFVISEAPGGPEYCDWFNSIPDGHPDVLMKYLHQLGMSTIHVPQVLQRTARAVADKGDALTDREFADVVTSMIGSDAVPAFRSAGVLQ